MGAIQKGERVTGPKLALIFLVSVLWAVLFTGCRPTESVQSVSFSTPSPPGTGISGEATAILVETTEPLTATLAATSIPSIDFRPDEINTEIGFLFPITVQHLTPGSVTLSFELDQAQPGNLVLWPESQGLSSAFIFPIDPDTPQQTFVIDGLQMGERYQVGVAVAGDDSIFRSPHYFSQAWGPIGFTVPVNDPYPIRVGIIGDSGLGEQVTFDLANLLAASQPDFVLHTGDLVYLAANNLDPVHAYAEKYYRPFEPVLRQAPIYPVVGNHEYDYDVDYRGSYAYYFAFPRFPGSSGVESGEPRQREWYAFSYGDIQFVLLNTQTFFGHLGREDQLAWLEQRLSDPSFAYSIVVFHVPPFTSGLHTQDGAGVQSDWVPLFQQYNVPLVLSGHDHNYERLEHQGTTYIVTGGGTSVLYPQSNNLESSRFFSLQMHFVQLDIYPDRIELSAFGSDGEVFDQVHISID